MQILFNRSQMHRNNHKQSFPQLQIMNQREPPLPYHHQYNQPQQQSQFPLHPQQILSSTRPLPTYQPLPLQQVQWNYQDQKNTWQLEKYNRLNDMRKQPMTVDRGHNDRLIIQFKDEQNKMISIYHNYHELETFCIHPLLFTHDLVCKDTKLLFSLKDQIDGSIRYKFRVKFASDDSMHAFCSAVAGYVSIKSYEEWILRNTSSSSDLMNMSVCSDNSTLSGRSSSMIAPSRTSFLPSQVLRQLDDSRQSEVSIVASSGDHGGRMPSPRISPIRIRSRSMDNILDSNAAGRGIAEGGNRDKNRRQCVDANIQTNPLSPPRATSTNGTRISNGHRQNEVPTQDNLPPNTIINVHIENLISIEAVREFGRILADAINTCIATKQAGVQAEKTKGGTTKEQKRCETPEKGKKTVASKEAKKKIVPDDKAKQQNAPAKKAAHHPHASKTPSIISNAIDPSIVGEKHAPSVEKEQRDVIKEEPREELAEEHNLTVLPPNTSSNKAKRKRPSTPSIWKIYESNQKLQELLKREKAKEHYKHRRSTNYFLRGSSVAETPTMERKRNREDGNEMAEDGANSTLDITVPESVVDDSDESREL